MMMMMLNVYIHTVVVVLEINICIKNFNENLYSLFLSRILEIFVLRFFTFLSLSSNVIDDDDDVEIYIFTQ